MDMPNKSSLWNLTPSGLGASSLPFLFTAFGDGSAISFLSLAAESGLLLLIEFLLLG